MLILGTKSIFIVRKPNTKININSQNQNIIYLDYKDPSRFCTITLSYLSSNKRLYLSKNYIYINPRSKVKLFFRIYDKISINPDNIYYTQDQVNKLIKNKSRRFRLKYDQLVELIENNSDKFDQFLFHMRSVQNFAVFRVNYKTKYHYKYIYSKYPSLKTFGMFNNIVQVMDINLINKIKYYLESVNFILEDYDNVDTYSFEYRMFDNKHSCKILDIMNPKIKIPDNTVVIHKNFFNKFIKENYVSYPKQRKIYKINLKSLMFSVIQKGHRVFVPNDGQLDFDTNKLENLINSRYKKKFNYIYYKSCDYDTGINFKVTSKKFLNKNTNNRKIIGVKYLEQYNIKILSSRSISKYITESIALEKLQQEITEEVLELESFFLTNYKQCLDKIFDLGQNIFTQCFMVIHPHNKDIFIKILENYLYNSKISYSDEDKKLLILIYDRATKDFKNMNIIATKLIPEAIKFRSVIFHRNLNSFVAGLNLKDFSDSILLLNQEIQLDLLN